jgi:microcystin-dependent protein
MSNNQIGPSLPVGSVIVFAGSESAMQKLEGWLVCDDSEVNKTIYPDLFAAIGFTNGGNGTDKFNLPQYQGYFLRGVDQGAGHDPNADARTMPASLGNAGDNPGSIQAYATALPTSNPLTISIPRVPTSSRIGNDGSLTGPHMSRWTNGSSVVQLQEGPRETRPKNKYVYFIIKSLATTVTGEDVPIPVGSVVPIAGTNVSSLGNRWLLCQGIPLNATLQQNQPLFDAIGVIHGGNANPDFYLPDYRGYFLRGVSGRSHNDPDADDRLPPLYEVTPPVQGLGASGDNVGSMQFEQTAQAVNKFTVAVTHLPTSNYREDKVDGHDNAQWHDLPTTMSAGLLGGGNESRPKNVYVDWYIKAF